MDLIIKVPVRAHVRDYLTNYYTESPAPLKKNDVIGSYLINLLERPNDFYRYKMNPDEYTDYAFTINKWNSEKKGFSLPESKVIEFNNWVEIFVKHEFVTFMDSKTEADVINKETYDDFEIREGIINYLERRNIPEQKQLNYESLKKYYYRKRQKQDDRKLQDNLFDVEFEKLGTEKKVEYSLVLLKEVDCSSLSESTWRHQKNVIRRRVNETLKRSPSRRALANYLWEKIDKHFDKKFSDNCPL